MPRHFVPFHGNTSRNCRHHLWMRAQRAVEALLARLAGRLHDDHVLHLDAHKLLADACEVGPPLRGGRALAWRLVCVCARARACVCACVCVPSCVRVRAWM